MRLLWGPVLIMIMAIGLQGCSVWDDFFGPKVEKEKPAGLPKFTAEVALKKAWSSNVGSGLGKKYNKLSPAIDGDVIYVADAKGEVHAYNRLSGKLQWRVKLKVPITGATGAGYGLVLVGTSKGEVIALNQSDGSVAWRSKVSGEVLSAPQVNSDVVVVQTLAGKLYAFESSSGNRRWVYDGKVPPLTLRGTSTPFLTNNLAVAGFSNGKILGFTSKRGVLRWEQRAAVPRGRSELDRLVDVDGPLAYDRDDKTLYASSYRGSVIAMHLETGRLRWQRDIPSYVAIGMGFDDYIYVSDVSGRVWALDDRNSASLWRQVQLRGRRLTSPVPFKDYVAVGDYEGYLHLMSSDDGRFVARVRADGKGLRSAPIALGDLLYVYGNGGKLTAFKVR